MTINEFAAEVHKNAVDHGWWDGERTFPEIVALIHSEVSEALEEYRDGKPLLYFPCNAGGVCCEEDGSAHCGSRPYDPENPNARCSAQSKKPEGIAAELADVIIRVLDYCAYAGIDIENVLEVKHEYNKSRPYIAFVRNRDKDKESNVKHDATVLTEIGYIKANTDEIKAEQKEQRKTNTEFVTRLTDVEASAKQAHKRLDHIEKRMDQAE